MIPADLFSVGREALTLALFLSLPIVGAALAAGVVTGLLQAYTKLSEPAINQAARIVAVLVVAVALVNWIAGHVATFTERVLGLVHAVGG